MPPPPSLVGAYYLQPPDARAIFLHNDLLCNDTCSVTGGSITYWGGGGGTNGKDPIILWISTDPGRGFWVNFFPKCGECGEFFTRNAVIAVIAVKINISPHSPQKDVRNTRWKFFFTACHRKFTAKPRPGDINWCNWCPSVYLLLGAVAWLCVLFVEVHLPLRRC